MEDERRWNPNDLAMYETQLADWERRLARRPVGMRRPYSLWGRLKRHMVNGGPQVTPCVMEVPVTLISCQVHKLQAKFRSGWRLLKFWIPTPDEVRPFDPDETHGGWRYSYVTERAEWTRMSELLKGYLADSSLQSKALQRERELIGKNEELQKKYEQTEQRLRELETGKAARSAAASAR